MYIPIMKVRQEEMRVSKKLNKCFSENIIPLYEVLKDEYEYQYEVDENGKFIMTLEPGKKRKTKIKKDVTEDDIVTLEKLSRNINNKIAFIDFFRFDAGKYGGDKVDINKVELAYRLSRNQEEYIKRLNEISNYDNLIPVVSIKEKFIFSNTKLVEIIEELKNNNHSIAIRIEDSFFENSSKVISKILGEDDYLLYDIGEQNIDSKIVELMDLEDIEIKAKKIILNSPRKLKLNNKQYENNSITALIDNSVVNEYLNYGFDGFGDYGGLKDQLPTVGGSNGKGAALALVYDWNSNSFNSFCNSDTRLGVKGYGQVIADILDNKANLNPSNDCPFYAEVENMSVKNTNGNWAKWNNLTLTRYIYQVYKYK